MMTLKGPHPRLQSTDVATRRLIAEAAAAAVVVVSRRRRRLGKLTPRSLKLTRGASANYQQAQAYILGYKHIIPHCQCTTTSANLSIVQVLSFSFSFFLVIHHHFGNGFDNNIIIYIISPDDSPANSVFREAAASNRLDSLRSSSQLGRDNVICVGVLGLE